MMKAQTWPWILGGVFLALLFTSRNRQPIVPSSTGPGAQKGILHAAGTCGAETRLA